MIKKILGIGSCRLLTPLYLLNSENVQVYNSLKNWFIENSFQGCNFLGKLHNTKEVIQFIELVLGKISLSDEILSLYLTSFSNYRCPTVLRENNPKKILQNIQDNFNKIDKIFIEISSIKTYKYNNRYVFCEHISSKNPFISNYKSLMNIQDKDEIIGDLEKIVFVSHFNIGGIKNRLIIKEQLEIICKKYDIPLILPYEQLDIINKKYLLQNDLLHYSQEGIEKIKLEYNKFINL